MKTERFLSQQDAATLSQLAEDMLRMRDVKLNFGERLIDLIAMSSLLPENTRRTDCVALNSTVSYREVGSSESKSVRIVCPQDVDGSVDRVSILAPLAMAMLGQPLRSIVEVALPFGKIGFIEITDIRHEPSGDAESAAINSQIVGGVADNPTAL